VSPEHRYTHGHHDAVLRSHRWRTAGNSAAYLLPSLRPGQRLLDVGCGPGTITLDLARQVAPGEVVGIDRAPEVLDGARAASTREGADNVSFLVGDVYGLDLPDDLFDVVHAHQVLQHLADPVAALVELRRVCRPGGLVAVRDADHAAMTWFPESAALERWLALYRQVAQRNGGEPDAGRRLFAWARSAGFPAVECSASAWCFSTPEDRSWWGETWAGRVTQSSLAEQSLELDLATREDLDELALGWRRWAEDEDGWFAVLHGEVLCRA